MLAEASAVPRQVLFLINSLAGGGAERVMMTLLEGSRDRMASRPFTLALLDDEPDAYPPPAWLPVHRLSTGGSLVAGMRSVRALVRRERPDLIVSFLTRANIIAATVGQLESIPCIISERVNTSAHLTGLRKAPSRLLVRLSYPRAQRIISVSGGVADDLHTNFGVRRGRVVTISNPVDVAAIQERGNDASFAVPQARYVVAVGRLTATKNMSLLLRAYADADLASRLVILGEGPERASLLAEIDALGLSDRVDLPGFIANPFAAVRAARFYVSASNGEGFPNALVEAMALARPVIATNCASGPSEIMADRSRQDVLGVLDTPYGRLVPTDDRRSLASALRWMDGLDDAELFAMGARGEAHVWKFTPERAVARYWEVFDAAFDAPTS